MKIELLETLHTGHPKIDAEHLKIVNAINNVSKAILAGEYDRCPELLDIFMQTCISHFKSEEQLLARLGYPGLADHSVFHNELVLKAKSVRVLCMDRDRDDSIRRCFDEMATLLIEDVVRGDLQFVSFLIEKGEINQRPDAHTPT